MKRRVNTDVQVMPPCTSSATAETIMIASGAPRKASDRAGFVPRNSTAIPRTAMNENRTALNPVLEYSRNCPAKARTTRDGRRRKMPRARTSGLITYA